MSETSSLTTNNDGENESVMDLEDGELMEDIDNFLENSESEGEEEPALAAAVVAVVPVSDVRSAKEQWLDGIKNVATRDLARADILKFETAKKAGLPLSIATDRRKNSRTGAGKFLMVPTRNAADLQFRGRTKLK